MEIETLEEFRVNDTEVTLECHLHDDKEHFCVQIKDNVCHVTLHFPTDRLALECFEACCNCI